MNLRGGAVWIKRKIILFEMKVCVWFDEYNRFKKKIILENTCDINLNIMITIIIIIHIQIKTK